MQRFGAIRANLLLATSSCQKLDASASFTARDNERAPAGTRQRGESQPDRTRSLSLTFLFCLLGVFFFRLFFWSRTVSTDNVDDFTGFLIGAKLVGSRWLYDVGCNVDLQKSLTGRADSAIIFVQLPVWAWLLKPFT